jgi:hypothetical protein
MVISAEIIVGLPLSGENKCLAKESSLKNKLYNKKLNCL